MRVTLKHDVKVNNLGHGYIGTLCTPLTVCVVYPNVTGCYFALFWWIRWFGG